MLNMSDGGGESVRECESSCGGGSKKKKVTVKDEFAQAVARIAVAQICEGVGFQNFHQSAMDTLSDVAVRYIRDVGKIANSCANLAGRSQCNVFDVIEGLEDLGYIQGFSGASDVSHCLLGSGAIKDIIRYVDEAEEIPFPYSIPNFPVVKNSKLNPTYLQTGENPPEHVPAWLPAFPDPKSYAGLNLMEKKEADSKIVKGEQVEDHGMAGKPLLNLQQQLAVNGREAAVAVDPVDAAEEKRTVQCNPFLAPPLQFGEKEVSQVVLPTRLSDETFMQHSDHAITRNHDSMLDAFTPAIEAVQSRSSNHDDGGKKVLMERRTAVRFRLESHRKTLGRAASLWDEADEELDSWVVNDNEKVNGKRPAEQILNSSMNNSQEQAHL